MMNSAWVERAIIKGVLLGLPACALVLFGRRGGLGEDEKPIRTVQIAALPTLTVCVLYIVSIVNFSVQWSVLYMVGWPLLGIGASLFGFGLAFGVPKEERWRFILADALVLVLTFLSIIMPN